MNFVDLELSRLRSHGLLVGAYKIGGIVCRYTVSKPISVPGNTREGFKSRLLHNSKEIECDAPHIILYKDGNNWAIKAHIYMLGSGPGDFCLSFSSISDAVDSILDYYFGDPSRMNPLFEQPPPSNPTASN